MSSKNPEDTATLRFRFVPDTRWYAVHPKTGDIEQMLRKSKHHRTSAKLIDLLERRDALPRETRARDFYPIKD